MRNKINYLELLSFALVGISAILVLNPKIGILFSIAAVLIQVFRGIFLSKRAIAFGVIFILVHSVIISVSAAGILSKPQAIVSENDVLPYDPLKDGKSGMAPPNQSGENLPNISESEVVEPQIETKLSFEFDWEMVAVLMGIFTSVTGWYVSKKHRKETLNLMNEIDAIYDSGKANPKESLEKLLSIKERLKKEFDDDKIDEATFQLLYKMADRDISDIKSIPESKQ